MKNPITCGKMIRQGDKVMIITVNEKQTDCIEDIQVINDTITEINNQVKNIKDFCDAKAVLFNRMEKRANFLSEYLEKQNSIINTRNVLRMECDDYKERLTQSKKLSRAEKQAIKGKIRDFEKYIKEVEIMLEKLTDSYKSATNEKTIEQENNMATRLSDSLSIKISKLNSLVHDYKEEADEFYKKYKIRIPDLDLDMLVGAGDNGRFVVKTKSAICPIFTQDTTVNQFDYEIE